MGVLERAQPESSNFPPTRPTENKYGFHGTPLKCHEHGNVIPWYGIMGRRLECEVLTRVNFYDMTRVSYTPEPPI